MGVQADRIATARKKHIRFVKLPTEKRNRYGETGYVQEQVQNESNPFSQCCRGALKSFFTSRRRNNKKTC